jgi:hypothetical protein
MKRKISAIVGALALAFGIGMMNANPASADIFNNAICWGIMADPSVSSNRIGTSGNVTCDQSQVTSHTGQIRVTQKWADGTWHVVAEHIPVSSNGSTISQAASRYCPNNQVKTYRAAWKHSYSPGGAEHYHSGAEKQVACAGFF